MNGMVEDLHGVKYLLNGGFHRSNGPAAIWANGSGWAWYLHGKEHRYYGYRSSVGKQWGIHGGFIKCR